MSGNDLVNICLGIFALFVTWMDRQFDAYFKGPSAEPYRRYAGRPPLPARDWMAATYPDLHWQGQDVRKVFQ